MSTAVKKLTWDDIKDWPESHGRTEIVDGELIMSPVPGGPHQRACTRLGMRIGPFIDKRKLGEFFSSPMHVILAKHVEYEPDLCFIVRKRLRILTGPTIDGPPDLIIEVISESNRKHDTVTKFRDYERHGVREYWLADPEARTIQVFLLEHGRYQSLGTFGPGTPVTTRVLEGLALDPADIF
ncbi:MAG: Uma2 family endonuclease [Acidobacteria bacterium]|nr:Uma2 family endonuclease [Acidobacteriota bacterium]